MNRYFLAAIAFGAAAVFFGLNATTRVSVALTNGAFTGTGQNIAAAGAALGFAVASGGALIASAISERGKRK